uniref:Hcy-binding domain-containing protein n=1 Tax=Petromyzon marinus TaxID=7757 RepID=S4RIA8_PETMA
PHAPPALEPRICTRWEMHRYAREAYALGVRYIGGCCGFEAYHVRAMAEELAVERGRLPAASEKHDSWGAGLGMHTKPWVRASRARKDYWEKLEPSTGRPFSCACSHPDSWGITKGHADLVQQTDATTENQLKALFTSQKSKGSK